MADLARRLADGPCLLLDGGMGTMLMAGGLKPGDAPDRLNLDDPDLVRSVHAAYVAAGSEAVHANTFGGNPVRLAHFGLAERCTELNRRAVEIARSASPAFVLADIGPTGEYLPPVGEGDLGRWREAFDIQAAALLDAGADGIHIETMSDLREAETALAAVRALDPDLPVLVSLTFDRKRRGFFTVMGNPLIESLNALVAAGATTVGANCTLASVDMKDLAAEALAGVNGRLVIQPNAGRPILDGGGLSYDQDPTDFVADLSDAIDGGLAAVGGCCGTDPRFIRLLAEKLAHISRRHVKPSAGGGERCGPGRSGS